MNAAAALKLALLIFEDREKKQSQRTLLISIAAGCFLILFLLLSSVPIFACLLFAGSNAAVPPEDIVISDSGFCWPTPGYTRITSPYGYRVHPITGKLKFHAGVDIGAAGGSPILAAAAGTVTISVYSSSYGNYVEIDHGDGVRTRYAHMSARSCRVGDTVELGQVIGLVGSTGNSTGNHCHFELRVNGTTYDPMQYFDFD